MKGARGAGVVLAVALVMGPAAAAAAQGYRVRPGDTLTGVAARLGVDPVQLAAVNDLPDPDSIRAGQVLTLPEPGTYEVVPGDTLSALAKRLGASQSQLAAANSLRDPDRILAGQTLRTAVGAPAPSRATTRASRPAATTTVATAATTTSTAPSRPASPPAANSPAAGGAGVSTVSAKAPATVGVTRRCPVPGAHFVDDFGYVRPDTGHVHQGIDLFAPRRTPVVAPVTGTVMLDPNPMGGKAIALWGVDGNRYYGAHLDAYGKTGRVAAGTVIGYVGNSGDAVGGPTHLHFEVHPGGGAAIDPYQLLVAACR